MLPPNIDLPRPNCKLFAIFCVFFMECVGTVFVTRTAMACLCVASAAKVKSGCSIFGKDLDLGDTLFAVLSAGQKATTENCNEPFKSQGWRITLFFATKYDPG